MDQEIWKDIVGYEGLYQVSNLGRVKSLITNKILKPTNRIGYKAVVLCKDKNTKTLQVHRLVAIAFIPNKDNLPQVNHKDGNKTNNFVTNLEWITPSDNRKHGIMLGLITFDSISDKILALKDNIVIGKYKSINCASRELNIDCSSICKVLKGKYKSYKGYTFQYLK